MSGLTKKVIYADRPLSQILGVAEGTMVSYSDLSKGLHKYIKDNDLKNLQARPPVTQAAPLPTRVKVEQPAAAPVAQTKPCRDCRSEIPIQAAYCDICGVAQ